MRLPHGASRRRPMLMLTLGLLLWGCADASTTSAPTGDGAPTVTSLAPSSGRIGSTIVVRGTNFSPSGNHVHFGIGYVADLSSADGTTLRFVVPDTLSPCQPGSPDPCATVLVRVAAGAYQVSVLSKGATSNAMTFTVTE